MTEKRVESSFLEPDSSKYSIRESQPDPKIFGKASRRGRSPLFYATFCIVLATFSLTVGWLIISKFSPETPEPPKYDYLNITTPGLSYRPMPSNEKSSLIYYKTTHNETFLPWVNRLTQFLNEYKRPSTTSQGQNIYNCDYNHPPKPGQVCFVDTRLLGPCTEENFYMYHRASPCVILKLNQIYDWKPQFYTDPKELPEDMPVDLKQRITDLANFSDRGRLMLNTVWVSCKGENAADAELMGPLTYYPTTGFPGYYFPYENSEGYLSPLVAVHFNRPKIGVLITIECRLWAKNIPNHKGDKEGSVRFELMID